MGKKRDKKSKSDESAKSVTSGSRSAPVYRPPHQAPAVVVERPNYITTTIRYPRYVIGLMEDWLSRNPGHSKTSMLLNGLRCMGVAIECSATIRTTLSATISLTSTGGTPLGWAVACQAHSRRRRWPERPGFTGSCPAQTMEERCYLR